MTINEAQVEPQIDEGQVSHEFGVPVDLPFSAYDTEGTVLNNPHVTVEQLAAMRRGDGQVRSLMRVLTLPIRDAVTGMKVLPMEGGEAEAKFIENMLTLPRRSGGMSVPLDKVMRQILLALVDGFAAFEQVYQVPEEGLLKGQVTLRKLSVRPSTSVKFVADEHGGFKAIKQQTTFQGKMIDVEIPAENVLYYAANEEENEFYGVSYFEAAHKHHNDKLKLYYVAHLAAQHSAVAGRVGEVPANSTPAERRAFQKALGNYGVTSSMTHPTGYKVTELRGGGKSYDYLGLINHHNSQMSKSVLAMFVDADDNKSMVDFSQDDQGMFLMSLQAIANEIASVFNNHLIPKFIDWNFGTGKYPQIQFTVDGDVAEKAIKDLFSSLGTAASANFSPDFLHALEKRMNDQLGLGLDYDGQLDEEFEERKEQAAKAAEAMAAGVGAMGDPKKDDPKDDKKTDPTKKDDEVKATGGLGTSGARLSAITESIMAKLSR